MAPLLHADVPSHCSPLFVVDTPVDREARHARQLVYLPSHTDQHTEKNESARVYSVDDKNTRTHSLVSMLSCKRRFLSFVSDRAYQRLCVAVDGRSRFESMWRRVQARGSCLLPLSNVRGNLNISIHVTFKRAPNPRAFKTEVPSSCWTRALSNDKTFTFTGAR